MRVLTVSVFFLSIQHPILCVKKCGDMFVCVYKFVCEDAKLWDPKPASCASSHPAGRDQWTGVSIYMYLFLYLYGVQTLPRDQKAGPHQVNYLLLFFSRYFHTIGVVLYTHKDRTTIEWLRKMIVSNITFHNVRSLIELKFKLFGPNHNSEWCFVLTFTTQNVFLFTDV